MPVTRSALARSRREFGFLDIGLDRLGDFTGQRFDALDAFALAAEFGVEGDAVQFRQQVFELGLAVLVPEEFCVGQPCGDDLVVAGDDHLAAVGGHHV